MNVNLDQIREDLRANELQLEELTDKYPHVDRWTLRELVAEYRKEKASRELEITIKPTIRKSIDTFNLPAPTAVALQEGFFRPLQLQLPSIEVPTPTFHSVGYQALVISDLHAPDHDDDAVDVVVQIGHALGINQLIINGDLFDVHALSRYVAASDKPLRWVDERTDAVKVAAYLRTMFPDIPITFIPGNHDIRVNKWIDSNAVPLQGLFTLEQLLGIEDLNFEITDRLTLANNSLLIKHGTRVSKHAGASVRKEIEDAGMSVIMGHCHRLSMVNVFRTIHEITDEPPLMGVELGCLSNLRPDYLSAEDTANWQHGAAVLTIHESGYWDVEPIRIHKGRAIFRGRLFKSHGTRIIPGV